MINENAMMQPIGDIYSLSILYFGILGLFSQVLERSWEALKDIQCMTQLQHRLFDSGRGQLLPFSDIKLK